MTLVELYNLTILHEALKAKQKVRTSDINFIYKTIPGAPKLLSKNGKIKIIMETFDKLSEETLKAYLIQKQNEENERLEGRYVRRDCKS